MLYVLMDLSTGEVMCDNLVWADPVVYPDRHARFTCMVKAQRAARMWPSSEVAIVPCADAADWERNAE